MRHIRYYEGMKAAIGKHHVITFCSDAKGPFIKVDGPDSADSGKTADSPAPKHKTRNRLVQRGPRIHRLDAHLSLERLANSA
jgi:hypothetical protein